MIKRPALVELQNVKTSRSDSDGSFKDSLSEEDSVLYKRLCAKGKDAAKQGDLTESLNAFKRAYEIKKTERILKRIQKIEELLEEVEDENEDFVELDNGLIIYRQLVERLYPHQIEGVKWIYNLFKRKKKGGILADDMGLGKTIQVIAALSAMFDMEVLRHVLLVLPLSLIPNWQKEFDKWAPGIKVKIFHGSPSERTKALDHVQRRSGVCMTTYGLIQTQSEQLGQTKYREDFVWDYIILDEGHKIKNPTKTTKALHAIPSKNRIILTGTPIQNNLRELWALFDWIMQGTLLGTQKTFKMEYENPITKARQRGASSAEIHLGNYMSESLRKIVDPYILRRTKGSVSAPKPGGSLVDKNQNNAGDSKTPSFPKLKKKNDFVVWTYLSDIQEEIYRDFLQQDSIKELLASKRSPLVYLNILKKICDHPRLLSRKACHELGLEANDTLEEEDFDSDKGKECAANRIDNITDGTLIKESGKLHFLIELLHILRDEGHRTLIFSLSRKVLNVIHRILLNKKFKVMRLDGTITKLSERELRVTKFQNDSSYEVFLLTTQVGGVGLTLTAADRVVIFDPSWNPATDAQAVDRIYRIGQDKNVVVYRLITCGTVEEKIYRRQIFKDSIIKQSTGDNKDPYRYFTNHELRELFELENTKESMTQRQLQDLHGAQRSLDPKLADHIIRIHSLPMFGVSDHDLMFSQDPDDVDPNLIEEHKDSIKNKVAEARVKVETEAQCFTGTEGAEARWGGFDIKPTISAPKLPETEPYYPVEGLYDGLDSLKIDDKMIANVFGQNKPPLDQDANELDEAILVADSPALDRVNNTDSRVTEIDESFTSEAAKTAQDTPSKALFQTRLSDISPAVRSGDIDSDNLRRLSEPRAFVESPLVSASFSTGQPSTSPVTCPKSLHVSRNSNADAVETLSRHDGADDSRVYPGEKEAERTNASHIDQCNASKNSDTDNEVDNENPHQANGNEVGTLSLPNASNISDVGMGNEAANNTNLHSDVTASSANQTSNGLDICNDTVDDVDLNRTKDSVFRTSLADESGRVNETDDILLSDDDYESLESLSDVSDSVLMDVVRSNEETNLGIDHVERSDDNKSTSVASEKTEAPSFPETSALTANRSLRSHDNQEALPDFDEDEFETVTHTRKLSTASEDLSDDGSMRLKIDDYDVDDLCLEDSDDGGSLQQQNQNSVIANSPVFGERKKGRLICESTDEEENDEQQHNYSSIEKSATETKVRRRSSAAPSRSFAFSDDSNYSFDSRRNSYASTGSKLPTLQVSFESEDEELL